MANFDVEKELQKLRDTRGPLSDTAKEDLGQPYESYRKQVDDPLFVAEQDTINEIESVREDTNSGVLDDVATGVKESLYQSAGGVLDYGNEIWDSLMVDDAFQWFDGRLKKWLPPAAEQPKDAYQPTGFLKRLVDSDFKTPLPVLDEAKSVTGGIIRSGTQFLTGFLPILGQVSKGTKALGFFKNSAKAKAFLDASIAGFPVDALGFNPNDPNIANVAARIFDNSEAAKLLEDYLGTDPNDPEALNRFKNGLNGVLVGAAFEGVFRSATAVKKLVGELSDQVSKYRASKAGQELLENLKKPVKEAPVEEAAEKAAKEGAEETAEKATKEGAEEAGQRTSDPEGRPAPAEGKITEGEMEAAARRFYANEARKLDLALETAEKQHFFSGVPDNPKLNQVVKAKKVDINEVRKALKAGNKNETMKLVDFNLDKIETEDDIKELINVFSEQMKPLAKDIKVTNKDIADLAEIMGTSEVKIAQLYKNVVGDDLKVQIMAVRNAHALSADDVFSKMELVAKSETNEAIVAMNKAAHRHTLMQKALSDIKTEMGRTLNMFKTPAKSASARAAAADSLVSMMGGRELNLKYARRVLDLVNRAENPDEALLAFSRAIKKTKFQRFRDATLEMYVNGLLSKPVTQVVNSLGNVSTITYSIAERYIAEKVGRGAAGGVAKGETAAMLNGLQRGLRRGWGLFRKAWETGQPSDLATKTDVRKAFDQAITAEKLEASGIFGSFIDWVGHKTRLPGKLLMSADELFKTINVDMERHALAYRRVNELGLSGDDFVRTYDDIVKGLDEEIALKADDFARYNTFTNDLERGSLSRLIQDGLQHDALGGLGRAFVPFFRTPVNILKFVGHRTPIVRRFSKTIAAELGSSDLAVRQLAKAKLATGSAIYLTGIGFAQAGLITGAEPLDPIERRRIRNTGWRPYSFRTPWGYMPYNRFDPIGLMLGISADLYQGSSLFIDAGMDGLEEFQKTGELGAFVAKQQMDRYSEAAGLGLMAIYTQLADRHYVAGIATVFDMIQGDEAAWHKAFEQQFVGMLPPFSFYSSFRKGIVDTVDPVIRDANSPHFPEEVRDILYRQIPKLSEEVRASRNLLGEPRTKTGQDIGMAWRAFNNLTNPFKLSKPTSNKLELEVERLDITEGDPGTVHTIGPGKITDGSISGETPLENDEKEFFQIEYGKLNREIEKYVRSKQYNAIEDPLVQRREIIFRLNKNKDLARILTFNKFSDQIMARIKEAETADEANLLDRIQKFGGISSENADNNPPQ